GRQPARRPVRRGQGGAAPHVRPEGFGPDARGPGDVRGGGSRRQREGPNVERGRDAEGAGRHALRQDVSHPREGCPPAPGRQRRPAGHRPGRRPLQALEGREGAAGPPPVDGEGVAPKGNGGRGVMKRQGSDDRAVYIISVAAELAGVHPQTLRIYERKGLLRPARTAGNTRRYSERDIDRLRMIQRLTQEQGLNLAGVKMIVQMEDEVDRMRQRMLEVEAELRRARRARPTPLGPSSATMDLVPLS